VPTGAYLVGNLPQSSCLTPLLPVLALIVWTGCHSFSPTVVSAYLTPSLYHILNLGLTAPVPTWFAHLMALSVVSMKEKGYLPANVERSDLPEQVG